jgi:hypothetical protein
MLRKKSFKFVSYNQNEYLNFVPAKSVVPDWYKQIPKYWGMFPPKSAGEDPLTIKACVPFLETLLQGYVMTTSYDLLVTQNDGTPTISWKVGGEDVLNVRGVETGFPKPQGFSPIEFVWKTPVFLKIPKGYSLLLTHPLNRIDLPFFSLSGLIDGPFVLGPGSIPFFVREGFEGVIPQGTPILQCIPIKNKKWKSKKNDSLKTQGVMNSVKAQSVLEGFYKKNIWKKKYFE